MLARNAENLYWFGRYLERAENLARLAEVNLQASTEHLPADGSGPWGAVVATMGATVEYHEALRANPDLQPSDFLIYSTEYPQSLRSTIVRARNLAREVREHLSREVFEEINRLYLGTNPATAAADERSLRALYRTVRRGVAAVYGLFDNTVLFTEGRDWFRCGMYMERADMTSRIIDAKYFIILPSPEDVGGPLDRYQWMAVLRSVSALEAFRKRYHSGVTGQLVTDLLMFDRSFPRSLLFCVRAFSRHFDQATEQTPDARTVRALRGIALLDLDLRAADAARVIGAGLHEFLDTFQLRLGEVDQTVADDIFRAVPDTPA